MPGTLLALSHCLPIGSGLGPTEVDACGGDCCACFGAAQSPRLSERAARILDGFAKGHANKVIAHTREITEAAGKVHIKSIPCKIRVPNRTQETISTLENGSPGDDLGDLPPKAESAPDGASMT
ncbi:MAG: hypothetical protein JSR91_20805 [Proteobacteria bacterium]|nr:hypothetical protein [Pseudomonadota bacterium]